MRRPDFSSLLHMLKRQERVSILVIANSLAWFIRETPKIKIKNDGDKNWEDFETWEIAEFGVIAEVIRTLGPPVRIERGLNNIDLIHRVHISELEHGSKEDAFRHLADGDFAEGLSAERVRSIYYGQWSPHLVGFIDAVRSKRTPSSDEMKEAELAIKRIMGKLLAPTGKGRKVRARASQFGFGDIGKSELNVEIATDVSALIEAGTKPVDAYCQVADSNGLTVANVKKIHQRHVEDERLKRQLIDQLKKEP